MIPDSTLLLVSAAPISIVVGTAGTETNGVIGDSSLTICMYWS